MIEMSRNQSECREDDVPSLEKVQMPVVSKIWEWGLGKNSRLMEILVIFSIWLSVDVLRIKSVQRKRGRRMRTRSWGKASIGPVRRSGTRPW